MQTLVTRTLIILYINTMAAFAVFGAESITRPPPPEIDLLEITPEVASQEDSITAKAAENHQEQISKKLSTGEPTYYGPGFAGWALHNATIGKGWGAGFGFIPSKSGQLIGFRTWFKHSNTGGSYSRGTGGHLEITVRESIEGSIKHPTNAALSTLHFKPRLQNVVGKHDKELSHRLMTFDKPAFLTAGKQYFLVMENIDPDPTANYLSINGIFMLSEKTETKAAFDLESWTTLEYSKGSWGRRFYHVPVLQLEFDTNADGEVDHLEGSGYFNTFGTDYRHDISGKSMQRQTISPQEDVTITSLMLYASRGSGPSNLVIELMRGSTSLETFYIDSNEIPKESTCSHRNQCSIWIDRAFADPITLKKGETYYLQLSTDSSTVYYSWPIRDGTRFGFSESLSFDDGMAQLTKDGGNNWNGWTYWGKEDRSDTDFQFWFRTQ